MGNWLKKNWPLIGLVLLLIFYVGMNIDKCASKINYKKQIRGLNGEITTLKRNMKQEAMRADTADERARIAEEEARKERVEKEKHKANAARKEEEKKELQEKIASLPPTEVVVHTIEILRVDPKTNSVDLDFDKEITLQEGGVLFTLVATRRNLEYLEGFSLVKKQYSDIKLALAKSEASDKKTQKANEELRIAIVSYKSQITSWEKAEVKWQNKFDLSEGQRKKARKKGRKEGAIAVSYTHLTLPTSDLV